MTGAPRSTERGACFVHHRDHRGTDLLTGRALVREGEAHGGATGIADGGSFGQAVGGYGIEIDATTPDSPPGTLVVAEIPDLLGPGLTGQMAYYETPLGAKVFAAGALDFAGSATFWPTRRILQNLWDRLAIP